MYTITHAEIDIANQVRVWIETDTKELIMLKLGTLKSLGIDDVKQIDEKTVFGMVDAIIAAQTVEKEAAPDKRIEEIDNTIAALTAEKLAIGAKQEEPPLKEIDPIK